MHRWRCWGSQKVTGWRSSKGWSVKKSERFHRSLSSRKQFLRSVELFAAISGFIVSWTHGVKHDFMWVMPRYTSWCLWRKADVPWNQSFMRALLVYLGKRVFFKFPSLEIYENLIFCFCISWQVSGLGHEGICIYIYVPMCADGIAFQKVFVVITFTCGLGKVH